MSYFITAHRKGAKINVPIEEKHKYITNTLIPQAEGKDVAGTSQKIGPTVAFLRNVFDLYKVNFNDYINANGTSKSNTGNVSGLNMSNSSEPRLFYRPQQLYLTQGTGARERIGDKIYIKSVQIILNITMLDSVRRLLSGNINEITNQTPVMTTTGFTATNVGQIVTGGTIQSSEFDVDNYVNHNFRANQKQFYKFRVMIVRFTDLLDEQQENEQDLRDYLKDWFNKIWVPQAIVPSDADGYLDINVVSNQSKMLRESTEYNGKYQIMYDSMIELNQNDFSKHIEITLKPKKNLNFGSDDHPTNEDWKNVYGFIIPPLYYKTDIDLASYQTIQNSPENSVALAEYTSNVKFTYYDI